MVQQSRQITAGREAPERTDSMPPSLNGSADGTHETRFQTVELALTQLSADRRGPVMARYGLLVIAIIATLGLIANLLMPSAYRKASLIFYGSELPAALALFGISFTRWFRLRWEAVVLFVGMLLLAAITLTSCITDNFRAATLGLLLFQMGAAAFFPWRPSHQFWFSAHSRLRRRLQRRHQASQPGIAELLDRAVRRLDHRTGCVRLILSLPNGAWPAARVADREPGTAGGRSSQA